MNPWYSVTRVRELNEVTAAELDDLDLRCMPEDEASPKIGKGLYWWIVTEHPSRKVVGFCGSLYWKPDNCVFLCRAGVVPEARGKGLQRRMIRARVAHAASIGAEGCYSYVASWNTVSANNLIRCGFELFEPAYPWGGEDVFYFWRPVVSSRKEV